ncbi:MAG: PLDc N-terminal domain-containing protein [Nitrospirota bacterium]|jgi:hypothetical protein
MNGLEPFLRVIDPAAVALALVALAPATLWVIALVDIVRSRFPPGRKPFWLVVVLLLPLVGFILYYAKGRKERVWR